MLSFKNGVLVLFILYPILVIGQSHWFAKPGPNNGKDALIIHHVNMDTLNLGNNPQISITADSFSLYKRQIHSLIQFNFDSLPKNSMADSAYLSLFGWTHTSGTGFHNWNGGSNVAWIERITSPWKESTVRWINKPTTTVQNRMTLDSAKVKEKDYPRIDVTPLINDILRNVNHGILIKMQTETATRVLNFHSSDHMNISKRPEIHVYYHSCLDESSNVLQICQGDSAWLNNKYRKTSGWYTDSLKGQFSCDSLVHTHLQVLNLKASITLFQGSLHAQGNGITHQWIDCATGNFIPGATQSIFRPTKNGSYKVISYVGPCQDTSRCFDFESLGFFENNHPLDISIIPNPTRGSTTISLDKQEEVRIELLDTQGKLLETWVRGKGERATLTIDEPKGLYFLKVTTKNGQSTHRIVKE